MKMSRMLKAVTFDFWDTLVYATDYTNARIDFLTNFLGKEGFSQEKELIKVAYLSAQKAFYNTWKHEQRYFSAGERIDIVLRELKITVSEESKHAIIKEFEEIVLRVPPLIMHDAETVLQSLHERYTIGLICDSGMSPGNILRRILKKQKLLKYFHATVFSDEIGYTKPHTKIFGRALEKLQVRPDEVAHIGDLLATDIAGAQAYGMKAIWYNWKNDKNENEMNIVPDYEIKKLTQLLQLLA